MRPIALVALLALACARTETVADDAASGGTGTKADWPTGATCGQDLADRIAKASVDLLYLSESDRPLTPIHWSAAEVMDGGVDQDTLRRLVDVPQGVEIEERGFLVWFDGIAVAQDWMDDQQKADAKRFAALRDLMDAELVSRKVFRFALPSDPSVFETYVLGRDGCGGIVGFSTEAVET